MAVAGEDTCGASGLPEIQEACMLTPAPAARSFSEFLLGRAPVIVDESAHAQQPQWHDASDKLSYFDAIMRQRSRRPITRCRLASRN